MLPTRVSSPIATMKNAGAVSRPVLRMRLVATSGAVPLKSVNAMLKPERDAAEADPRREEIGQQHGEGAVHERSHTRRRATSSNVGLTL